MTHKGLIQQFGQHFIRTGELEKEYGKIITEAHEERELADYHTMTGSFERLDVEKHVSGARKFVEKMQEVIAAG